MYIQLEVGGNLVEVELAPHEDGYLARIDGGEPIPIGVTRGADGHLFLRLGERASRIVLVAAQKGWQIWSDGEIYQIDRFDARRPSRPPLESDGDLTATLPGQVIEVLVNAGQRVEKGETLLVLEAMKMETRLRAPRKGVIRKVHCGVGQRVDRGERLIDLEDELEDESDEEA